MSDRVDQEPGYVLHRRNYRETSLMVDLFSLNHGRLTVVARGANSPKSPLKAQLQPFQPMLLAWQGRSDLKTLTSAESRMGPDLRRTERLYCGLYLNELLQRLLPPAEPFQTLFAHYIETLDALAGTNDFEPTLRRFEWHLVEALGYAFDWSMAMDTGAPVTAGGHYYYDPEQGLQGAAGPGSLLQGLRGEVLLELADARLETAEARRTAKRVMRVLIDHLLQGRTLHSRALFTQLRGDKHES
ncbi:DNA repair protein RecO [Marinobacter halodurans]|uniref:DNA repair protein RecO n=1 Tax=Marinobacter halodurans TaxID=2528979 RepID=A0ABY1ZRR0_9GAMM|nr:DNA repair protein RecO [Marinobacter halodurans]TBW57866.1 DNA repair protein RecO [Marinobacter halodurans]